MVIHVGEDQNGHEIELPVHQRFLISLPENRTTGYRWFLEAGGEPVCSLIEDGYESGGMTPGRGGSHFWRFEAVQPGGAALELAYRRPWEGGGAPARTFTLRVRVTPDR
jgi:predicted secreted protein